MIVHDPFFKTILGPALRIGDATLTLFKVERDFSTGRDRATFILNGPDLKYTDNTLQTGVGGGSSKVELFESYLGFMLACAESREYVGPDGNPGENANLFPERIGEWIVDNKGEIESASSWICDEDGYPHHFLISE